MTVAWTAGELDLTPGVYSWQLSTSSGLDRVFAGSSQVLDVIT